MNMEFTLLYVVTGTLDEAKKIGKYLVEKKLAACVNILPNMISIYSWNQELKEDNETKSIWSKIIPSDKIEELATL